MTERIEKVLESIKPGITGEKGKAFIDDGLLDSLDLMNLLLALEEEFGIEIDPEDVRSECFQSAGAIAGLIESYKKASGEG